MDKVVSLNGGPISQPGEPNAQCVEALEKALEMARAGAIDGVAIVGLYPDNCSDYRLGGRVGGYTMLGAAQMVVQELALANLDGE
ncbi:4-hydroxythreonine-4-phosphate dehydrogenase PdxA [Roseibium sediminis]|uniref:4-hydroxythreonine-4-phosphate dehydrogenase PdxA n=1 Tax=Roseibium sediminis TaxID=1775174 RepID=UPI00123D5C6C|nr:4-hydroxythreonine-4-phosphate dehydrogenase PdxA [Roseibium sediminis]